MCSGSWTISASHTQCVCATFDGRLRRAIIEINRDDISIDRIFFLVRHPFEWGISSFASRSRLHPLSRHTHTNTRKWTWSDVTAPRYAFGEVLSAVRKCINKDCARICRVGPLRLPLHTYYNNPHNIWMSAVSMLLWTNRTINAQVQMRCLVLVTCRAYGFHRRHQLSCFRSFLLFLPHLCRRFFFIFLFLSYSRGTHEPITQFAQHERVRKRCARHNKLQPIKRGSGKSDHISNDSSTAKTKTSPRIEWLRAPNDIRRRNSFRS